MGNAEPALERPAARSLITTLIYVGGVVQGLALVTFPAASAIFTSPDGFQLTAAQYGNMFVPQVLLAIAASAIEPLLVRKFGLRVVLLLGLGMNFIAVLSLALSPLLAHTTSAYPLLLLATGALGLGFGTTVPALNTATEALFPKNADGAVLILNALLGLGTALAPALITFCTALGAWWILPLTTAAACGALIVTLVTARLSIGAEIKVTSDIAFPSYRFWLYPAAVLLYGIVETQSGNWIVLYLTAERHTAGATASYSLTAFWLAVTIGRILFAWLGRTLPIQWIYVALPVLLATSFQLVGHADGAVLPIAAFALTGLACSALLPLSISLGSAEFPKRQAISGELIAFYQIGYGIAAFGTGPLHDLAGVSFATLYSAGSFVAILLAGVALLIARGAKEAVSAQHPGPR